MLGKDVAKCSKKYILKAFQFVAMKILNSDKKY